MSVIDPWSSSTPGANGLELLAELYRRPLVNVNYVNDILGVTFPTANRVVAAFEEIGLLREVTGQRRGRRYRYEPTCACSTTNRRTTAVDRRRITEAGDGTAPAP